MSVNNEPHTFEKFAAAVAFVANAETERDPQARREDTLRRVRVRPMGRAVEAILGQRIGDKLADLYDPDQELRRYFYRPAAEYAHLQHAPVRMGDEWLDPPGHHRLLIPYREQDRQGRWHVRVRPQIVRTAQDLAALAETPEWRRARFLEATGDWRATVSPEDYARYVALPAGDVIQRARALVESEKRLRESGSFYATSFDVNTLTQNVSSTSDIDQEFVPLSGGAYSRQLYLHAHWEQTSKSFEMRHHSELAGATIGINSDFSLGRGVSWKLRAERVARVWQEFWDRNDMERRFRQWSDDFTWQGQLFIRKHEQLKGFITVRSIDPGNFYEIVTNPEDVEEVYYYAQQNPTPWQLNAWLYQGRRLKVPTQRYVITQYSPQEMLHVKANVSASEKWGRSDYFAALSTLKRHRDWTNASTLKAMLQANLVWVLTLTGEQEDVDAFVSDSGNTALPGPGGLWIQNQALKLEPMHQDVSGPVGQGSVGDFLTALYATSQNMPVTYFNAAASGGARATALTQGEPFVKKIQNRQQVLRGILDHLFAVVMDVAIRAGRLRREDVRGDEADPEWIFPTIYEEDRGAKFRDLGVARDSMSISHQTLATQQAQELGLAEYSYTEEMAQIAREREDEALGLGWWPEGSELAAGMSSEVPAAPPTQPGITDGAEPSGVDDAEGRGEGLKGADERRAFRQEQRGHSTDDGG